MDRSEFHTNVVKGVREWLKNAQAVEVADGKREEKISEISWNTEWTEEARESRIETINQSFAHDNAGSIDDLLSRETEVADMIAGIAIYEEDVNGFAPKAADQWVEAGARSAFVARDASALMVEIDKAIKAQGSIAPVDGQKRMQRGALRVTDLMAREVRKTYYSGDRVGAWLLYREFNSALNVEAMREELRASIDGLYKSNTARLAGDFGAQYNQVRGRLKLIKMRTTPAQSRTREPQL